MDAGTKAVAFLTIAVLALSALIIFAFVKSLENEAEKSRQECGTEAKTCPDGRNVTRALPYCTFQEC